MSTKKCLTLLAIVAVFAFPPALVMLGAQMDGHIMRIFQESIGFSHTIVDTIVGEHSVPGAMHQNQVLEHGDLSSMLQKKVQVDSQLQPAVVDKQFWSTTTGAPTSFLAMTTTVPAATTAGACITTGPGSRSGHACVFPFNYRGKAYNACTSLDHTGFWCSTQTDAQNFYIKGNWGDCSATCPQAGSNHTPTTTTGAPTPAPTFAPPTFAPTAAPTPAPTLAPPTPAPTQVNFTNITSPVNFTNVTSPVNFTNVTSPAPIRLRGGSRPSAGRIEIYYRNVWGTVCDDNFGNREANVACSQLGYISGRMVSLNLVASPGSGPIWLDDLQCYSNEASLSDCRSRGWGSHNCVHNEDVAVECEAANTTAVPTTTTAAANTTAIPTTTTAAANTTAVPTTTTAAANTTAVPTTTTAAMSAPTPAPVCAADARTVVYDSYEYRTLTGLLKNGENFRFPRCENTFTLLLPGYEIAPYSDDVLQNVVAAHHWSTQVMVFADGSSYYTHIQRGTWSGQKYSSRGDLQQSGIQFKARICNLAVLIRKPCQAPTSVPTFAPPTPAPTPALSAFQILSGRCRLLEGGHCYASTNYPSNYPNRDRCSAQVRQASYLSFNSFNTERNYDFLTIGNARYHGFQAQRSFPVASGTHIMWESDGSVTKQGWKICV